MSLGACLVVLLGWSSAAHALDRSPHVIPPGQETLIAEMLGRGAALPDGCTFAGGQVDHGVVSATYRCPAGDALIQLSHPSVRDPAAVRTARFALSVVSGSPPARLLGAIETLIRARESDFQWSMLSLGGTSRGFASVFGLPSWCFGLLLLGMTAVSAVSAFRAFQKRGAIARWPLLEAVIVAVVVVVWLQIDAEPPAHMDTATDVALARDCIASGGRSCLGHAASAIGLVQGQAFTYALAAWLYLGLSMRALCFVAACVQGAATGLLHHATARRFGGVAWVVSAVSSALGVYMTSYPTIWNPTWFVLPLTIAFLATLTAVDGQGIWSAFVAGVGFAITSESHVLFGPFIAVAVVIVLIAAPRAVMTATVLLGGFVLTEIVLSPVSFAANVIILHGWVAAHRLPAVLGALSLLASLPVQVWLRRRLAVRAPEVREGVAVGIWLSTGAIGLGLVLPWAVSRPAQIRYYGAAFPAIAFAAGWLLDAVTLRARSPALRAVSCAVFALLSFRRMTGADFASGAWFMDDGMRVATTSGLVNESALDIQVAVRPIPAGALGEVAAAFAGTADLPALPARIVRAVRPKDGVDVPNDWTRIPLARGQILTSAIDAWAHPEEAELCAERGAGTSCLRLTRDDFRDIAVAAGGAVHYVFGLRIGRSAARIEEWARQGARSLLWKIPLRPTGVDEAREVLFAETADEEIVAVEGTCWTVRDRNRATLGRPAPDVAAFVTVRTPIAAKFEAGVPPMPFELREGETGVLPDLPRS